MAMQRLFWMTEIGTLFDPQADEGEARIITLAEAPGRIVAVCPAAIETAAQRAGFPYVAIIDVQDSEPDEAEAVQARPQASRPEAPVPILMLFNRRYTRVIN